MTKSIMGFVAHPNNEFHNLSSLREDIARGYIWLVTNSELMNYGFDDCINTKARMEPTIGPDHFAIEAEQVTSIDQINIDLVDLRTAYCYYDGSRESCYYTITIMTWDNKEEVADDYGLPVIAYTSTGLILADTRPVPIGYTNSGKVHLLEELMQGRPVFVATSNETTVIDEVGPRRCWEVISE